MARGPLKRVIQKNVQDPLAEAILAGRVKDGELVSLTVRNGDLILVDAAQRKAA